MTGFCVGCKVECMLSTKIEVLPNLQQQERNAQKNNNDMSLSQTVTSAATNIDAKCVHIVIAGMVDIRETLFFSL